MKILIFSDSHGELSHMQTAIQEEKPDYVFHLGDYDTDAEELERFFPMLPMTAVRGNCDRLLSDTPNTRLITIGGLRIFLCHGHTLGVKGGLLRAAYAAREQRADILLYGHTHVAHAEKDHSGLVIFNPGSCGFIPPATYGCLTIEQDGGYRLTVKEC